MTEDNSNLEYLKGFEGDEPDDSARQQNINDIKSVMATGAGRRFISRFIAYTHPFKLSYGDRVDFLEGQRDIGLRMIAELMDADETGRLLLKALITDEGNK